MSVGVSISGIACYGSVCWLMLDEYNDDIGGLLLPDKVANL